MEPYDLVGIGFGPSNLSVAVAAEETGHDLDVLFFERKPAFAWHPGLMFEGSEMQVSFLKDLISMRNPRSRYSFTNYLAENDRLAKFVNLRTFYPTRIEFNGYYSWAADQFAGRVRYGTEVVRVTTRPGADGTDLLEITVRDTADGTQDTVLARNLVLAPGGQPSVPDDCPLGSRVFHAQDTLFRLAESFSDHSAPYHFNIVGAGQTAADVFIHLRRAYPDARVTTCMRGFAMVPEDDTHFINEFFLPEMPGWFHGSDPKFRERVLERYGTAAHTGVSYDLIPRIYREHYEDLVAGTHALRIHRFTEFTGAREDASGAVAEYRSLENGETFEVAADAVILATGYRYPMPVPVLRDVQDNLRMDGSDRYEIERDYSIARVSESGPRIYLQGFAEATHGFSEVLLSLMPFRAAEIVDSVLAGAPVGAR